MSGDRRMTGLALKVGPLGEHDRLLTLLSDEAGVVRLAVPGARKPRSSLAAAVPLTLLDLQVVGRRGLKRVRQLQVVHNYGGVGRQLETLAAAQALAELAIALVAMWQLEAVQTVGDGTGGVIDAATIAEEQRFMDFTLPDLRAD